MNPSPWVAGSPSTAATPAQKWPAPSGVTAQIVAIGTAVENDTASALTVVVPAPAQVVAIGRVVETDSASTLAVVLGAPPQVVSFGQASEVETAQPLTVVARTTVPITQAQEIDTASSLVVASSTRVPIGVALEVDSTSSLGLRRELGSTLVETDQAMSLVTASGPTVAAIGRASEVETTLGPMGVTILLGMLAEEGDTAYPLTPVLGPVVLQLASQPQETDELIGGPLTYKLSFSASLSTLEERSSLTPMGVALLGAQLSEQDSTTSLSVLSVFRAPIAAVTEVDQARAMTVRSTITVPLSSTPAEVDATLGHLAMTLALAGMVTEQDSPGSLAVMRRLVVRRILLEGELRRVLLLGVSDGQGGVRLAREQYWDGQRRREFTTELVVEGG